MLKKVTREKPIMKQMRNYKIIMWIRGKSKGKG